MTNRVPLLPYEKYLASQLGISEDQYQQFKALTLKHSIAHPAKGPQAGPFVPIIVNLAIGVGLSLLSALLFPPQEQKKPARLTAKQIGGRTLNSNQRASPRQGFSGLQEPATIGQNVPVVIANRENGYGGVRVNLPLIWSQLLSMRGGQMFKGIFLAGAGSMQATNAWDNRGWAFGNNTLGAYAFEGVGENRGAKFTIYYDGNGGRLNVGDYLLGRDADRDLGNSVNSGGNSIYSVKTTSNNYEDVFCMAETPSTSTQFGLYGWCPNAMMQRTTYQIGPTIVARVSSPQEIVRIDDDASALCRTWEAKFYWSCRGSIDRWAPGGGAYQTPATTDFAIVGETVEIGDRIRYKLTRLTDVETRIKFDTSNADISNNKSSDKIDATSVASTVAGIQVSADNALIPGELYRIGSAWAVLENRNSQTDPSETIFISDQDEQPPGNGNTMTYDFVVVKSGRVRFVGPGFNNPPETGTTILPPQYDPATDLSNLSSGTENRYKVCSAASQIFRMALASVASVREVTVVEIGLKSRVGITVRGMPEFRSCPTIQEINAAAGENQRGDDANGRLSVSIFRSNQLSTSVIRYSCFRIWYRPSSTDDWTDFGKILGIAGNSEQDFYNYFRIEFPTASRWEIRLEPISSWEIRRDEIDNVLILDSAGKDKTRTADAGGVVIRTNGYKINPTRARNRRIQQLEPKNDIGFGLADNESAIDRYGHFAEAFIYSEIQSSVRQQPEHEIVYVNFPDAGGTIPSYECLATVGINIQASLEFSSLQQFSGYCINGYEMRRLLDNDSVQSSHLFPDWLRELMTSIRVGPLPPLPDIQIDRDSFQAAAQWCADRNYYYDAVETEPLNILQWASDVAQAHLLKLVRIGGRYHLIQAVDFDNPLPIAALFTNGNIIEGTFKMETVDYEARQPIIVQTKWREESTEVTAPLFPRERSATVQEYGIPTNSPIEELDLSKWCTNRLQAIDAACYLIRFRRLSDHRISFQTTPDLLGVSLSVGSIVQVAIDVTNYDTAVQGVITADGRIVTTRPDLAPSGDGSYAALLWDGSSADAAPGTITITGGVASPASHFFAIDAGGSTTRTYEINSLSVDQNGVISVEAFYHPLDDTGKTAFVDGWTTYQSDGNWEIRD